MERENTHTTRICQSHVQLRGAPRLRVANHRIRARHRHHQDGGASRWASHIAFSAPQKEQVPGMGPTPGPQPPTKRELAPPPTAGAEQPTASTRTCVRARVRRAPRRRSSCPRTLVQRPRRRRPMHATVTALTDRAAPSRAPCALRASTAVNPTPQQPPAASPRESHVPSQAHSTHHSRRLPPHSTSPQRTLSNWSSIMFWVSTSSMSASTISSMTSCRAKPTCE